MRAVDVTALLTLRAYVSSICDGNGVRFISLIALIVVRARLCVADYVDAPSDLFLSSPSSLAVCARSTQSGRARAHGSIGDGNCVTYVTFVVVVSS